MRWTALVVLLGVRPVVADVGSAEAANLPPRRADGQRLPASLTPSDWSQIRRALRKSGHEVGAGSPLFVHEAQLFGHGDPLVSDFAEFGWAVAADGNMVVVGAHQANTPGGGYAGAAFVFERLGSTWYERQRLTAPDGASEDQFGSAVSIHGNTIVVGAVSDDAPGAVDAGSAHVFVRVGPNWIWQQKLLPADVAAYAGFGVSVSAYGDTVLIGAWGANAPGVISAGAAYVFERTGTTWTEQQKLVAPDGEFNDRFGGAVSLSGDTAAVGASLDNNPGGSGAGSAYVFVRTGAVWTEQQKVLASDGAVLDQFGSSLSVSLDTLVVGAPGAGTPLGQTGSAYVFLRSGTEWSQQQELVPSDGADFDSFGTAVSLSGQTIVVGASGDDIAEAIDAGSAYVFVFSGATWNEQQKLFASDGAASDHLGSSVSISGELAMVGAPTHDTAGMTSPGAAYAFVRSVASWTEEQKLPTPDQESDALGSAISISGDTLVVGAFFDDISGEHYAGSAYVFVRSGSAWSEQQKLAAPDGAYGDLFGSSVAVFGDTVVIGAPTAREPLPIPQPPCIGEGSAYVYVRSGTSWTLQQKLTASNGEMGDCFGDAVSVSQDTILIGAPSDGFSIGAAYVFVRSGSTWTQQQKLEAADEYFYRLFGWSVSLDGETAVVAAYNDGSAYVYVRAGSTWTQQQKLVATTAVASAVSVSGDTAVVGAELDAVMGQGHAGQVHVFVRSGTVWSFQAALAPSSGGQQDLFGHSVRFENDTVVAGAVEFDFTPSGPGPVGKGYATVFRRSGTSWSEVQTVVAPDGALYDLFGNSVGLSGDTLVVGAYSDTTPAGGLGSAHVFREGFADLAATKTDGQAAAVPGEPLTYVVVVSNAGPAPVTGATVTDVVPAILTGATWTCAPSPGSTCSAAGSGSINDTINLLAGGSATYVLIGTVDPSASGALVNTASVAVPGGVVDPNPNNDSATDIDTLTPEADLVIVKTDSADPVNAGDPLTYAITVTNDGPSDANGVTVVDTLPVGVAFGSSLPGPPTCTLAGAILTCSLGGLSVGGSAAITINVTVDAGASGMLVNTATVSGGATDPDPRDNTSTAATAVGRRDGELSHGMNEVFDLAALPGPVQDEDVFRIEQKPYSSYEVVVDATSGDIGSSDALFLTRLAPDGTTVLHFSAPIGAGFSRSLRWINNSPIENEGETIRVRSTECTTDCGTDDTYRIRAYETTNSAARFNNSGTQITVLVLQNPTNDSISGYAHFRSGSGTLVATEPFDLPAKSSLAINTAAVPGAETASGAITVAHDGRYGELSGKTVALEPATGFSFDTPLVPRPR